MIMCVCLTDLKQINERYNFSPDKITRAATNALQFKIGIYTYYLRLRVYQFND